MTEKRPPATAIWGEGIKYADPALDIHLGRWYATEDGEIVKIVAQDYKINPTLFLGIREDYELGMALVTTYKKNGFALGMSAPISRELSTASVRQSTYVKDFLRSKTFHDMLKIIFTEDPKGLSKKFWLWAPCLVSSKGTFIKPTLEHFIKKENESDDR